MHEVVPKLQANCLVGMQTGDVEYALYSLNGSTFLAEMSGQPLKTITTEYRRTMQIALQYNLRSSEAVYRPYVRVLMELTGEVEPSDWTAEFQRHLSEKKAKKATETHHYVLLILYMRRGRNALIMGDVEKADRARQMLEYCRKYDLLFGSQVATGWVCCLASILMFKRTRQRRYMRLAMKELKWFELMAKHKGAINIAHMYVRGACLRGPMIIHSR